MQPKNWSNKNKLRLEDKDSSTKCRVTKRRMIWRQKLFPTSWREKTWLHLASKTRCGTSKPLQRKKRKSKRTKSANDSKYSALRTKTKICSWGRCRRNSSKRCFRSNQTSLLLEWYLTKFKKVRQKTDSKKRRLSSRTRLTLRTLGGRLCKVVKSKDTGSWWLSMRGASTTVISKLMRIMTQLISTGSCLGLVGFKMRRGKEWSFKELLEETVLLNFPNKLKFTSTLKAYKNNNKNKVNHSIITPKADNIKTNSNQVIPKISLPRQG